MKNLRIIFAVTLMLGSVFTVLSQTGVDSVKNFNIDVNQNPTLDNDNQNINNPNQPSEFDKDVTSPGENSSPEYQLKKEDSVRLFKQGGALINTDTMSSYPVKDPSDRSYGGSKNTP